MWKYNIIWYLFCREACDLLILCIGPIRYFNDRLLWLEGHSGAIITDLHSKGKSHLRLDTLSNVTNVHVKDQMLMTYPRGLGKHKIKVVPDPVWSVSVQGIWNEFTISWSHINNTNHGQVYYDVLVNNSISEV